MPVILAYDDTHFEWTTDEIVMNKLGLRREKFEDLILLWSYPLNTIDINKDLLTASEMPLSKARLHPGLSKIKALYTYPVIYDNDCVCRTLEKDQKMPKETEELIGMKLPSKCYLYVLLGLISGKLMSAMTSGKVLEYSNIVKNDSLCEFNAQNKGGKYEILLEMYKNSPALKPYLEKVHKLSYIDNMGKSADIPEDGKIGKDMYWSISQDKIVEEMDRQGIKADQLGTIFCTKWYISDIAESRNYLKKVEKLKDTLRVQDLVCQTIFIYLEKRKFITGSKQTLILGSLYQMCPLEFQDEGLIFFELLAYGGLSGMSKGSSETKDHTSKQLISEVFSLVPMRLKKGSAEDWNEYQVSKEFANFIPLARNSWQASREFMEGLLFTIFCSSDDSRTLDADQFEKAFELLPFWTKPNYLLGLLMVYLLDEADKRENNKLEHPLANLNKKFGIASDITGDIKRGYNFWNYVMEVMSGLYTPGAIAKERYECFVEANRFLEEKLEVIGIKDLIKSLT
jgi:hypothetical protein